MPILHLSAPRFLPDSSSQVPAKTNSTAKDSSARFDAHRAELVTFANLRDTPHSRLLSGELSVADAEKEVSA